MSIVGEDAQSEVLLLDPALSFGLVSTASKTKSFSDVPVATKTVPKGTSYHVLAVVKNKSQPQGVTFDLLLRIRFTAPQGASTVVILNDNIQSFSINAGDIHIGLHNPSDTSNIFNNTGSNIIFRNVTTNEEITISSGEWDPISVSPGDIIEVILPYVEGWELKVLSNTDVDITDLSIFYRVDATIYHDGSLTGGKGVVCSFEVYDSDGQTLLGKYEFEGIVNPFALTEITRSITIRAGETKSLDIDLGDYVLDPSAPTHYLRAVIASIEDRVTNQAVSLDEFNALKVQVKLEDGAGNVIASSPLEDVTQLPFNGSWSDAINAPSETTTYKAKLHIEVNPKYAKRYRIGALVQLGM
ncbi:MAG: hypothetical protein DRJ38_10505 [Thermoprotei archaeon]|nr:MAG: hypothetical protein DRJ38_10505 [Thermoprotei archaeon]